MTIDDQIRDEKLQCDINREAAKISASSSGKIDQYEYVTGEEILLCNQKEIIKQVEFTYSPLGKAFEKQTKTIEDQGRKEVHALKSLESSDKQLPSIREFIPKERLNPEIIDEIERTEEEERKIDGSKMVYKGHSKAYDFRKIKTIRVFGNEIRKNFIKMSMENDEQDHFSKHIREFKSKARPQNPNLKNKRRCIK